MPIRINQLQPATKALHCRLVTWQQVRSAFIRHRTTLGTQQQVASKAGLSQGDISKIESNDKYGPTVGKFIKAIEHGFGMHVSDFFLRAEQGQTPKVSDSRHIQEELHLNRDRNSSAPTKGMGVADGVESGAPVSSRSVKQQLRAIAQSVLGLSDLLTDTASTTRSRSRPDAKPTGSPARPESEVHRPRASGHKRRR
jgi:DNA-binding XRE family transcriptional regulator